jgi:putative SOS response-associated peptidase YedK
MCNEVRRIIALGQIRDDFSHLRIPLRFPEGAPNMAPLDSIRITDPTAIVRAAGPREPGTDTDAAADLLQRRWSWPGPSGKPVYNIRSETGANTPRRCLVPVDGFYEHTDPAPPAPGTPRKRRKDKWLFTHATDAWFCIAAVWRPAAPDGQVPEAFALLTTEPGPDVAPYHSRQVVVLARDRWSAWLDPATRARDLIAPLPAGTLRVEQVG